MRKFIPTFPQQKQKPEGFKISEFVVNHQNFIAVVSIKTLKKILAGFFNEKWNIELFINRK
jgi:hypothetical protein